MSDKRDFRTKGYVKVGDVLLLPWGTQVMCPQCPRYFDEHASPYASGTYDRLVQVGVPIERTPSLQVIRDSMTDHIESIFTYYHITIDGGELQRFIRSQVPDINRTSFMVPAGLYEVTNIDMRPKGQKFFLRTYREGQTRPEYRIYILQGGFHATHMDEVKIVVDPDNYLSNGPG